MSVIFFITALQLNYIFLLRRCYICQAKLEEKPTNFALLFQVFPLLLSPEMCINKGCSLYSQVWRQQRIPEHWPHVRVAFGKETEMNYSKKNCSCQTATSQDLTLFYSIFGRTNTEGKFIFNYSSER